MGIKVLFGSKYEAQTKLVQLDLKLAFLGSITAQHIDFGGLIAHWLLGCLTLAQIQLLYYKYLHCF